MAEREILAVNAAFYAAFADRDVEAMDNLWARQCEVACLHPGWEANRARSRVLARRHDGPEEPDPAGACAKHPTPGT